MTLEEQLRAQPGDWMQGGIDRASELAKLLRSRGITDLSQLSIQSTDGERQNPWAGGGDSGDGASGNIPWKTSALQANGNSFGTLGMINNDGSITQGWNGGVNGPDALDSNGSEAGGLLGRSTAGHGMVDYTITQGPDGKPTITPVWQSSSSAADIQGLLKVAGVAAGGAYAAGGSGGAAAGTTAAGGNSIGYLGAEAAAGGNAITAQGLGSLGSTSLATGGATAGGAAGVAGLSGAGGAAAGGATNSIGLLGASAPELAAPAAASTSLGSTGVTAAGAGGTASGWDTLGKLAGSGGGKLAGAVGGALASGAAANALAPNSDTSKVDELFNNLLSEQGKVSQRGDDQWQSYLNTWQPIEQKLADKSLNYDTPERRQQAADAAAGQVGSSFDLERQSAVRDMQAAGLDPSTIAALGAASNIEEAKAKAGASNKARSDIETQGLGLLDNAAKFGRQLPATSLQASNTATGTAGTASNINNSAAQIDANNTNARNSLFGDLFGAGLQAYGMYSSSKKTKHMGGKVRDGLSAVAKSPAKNWRYKAGQGDGNSKARMGPTAESLAKVAPSVSNGKQVDGIALAGLHHAALGEVSKRLGKIERKLGLSDRKGA